MTDGVGNSTALARMPPKSGHFFRCLHVRQVPQPDIGLFDDIVSACKKRD
jgi:hypothetical protein